MEARTTSTMIFDYSKLRGRTVEIGKTDKDVATAANMNPSTYSQKINGKGVFSQDQICAICSYLRIQIADIPLYFFTLKV
jgi:transcriptional regulator with XRE-family HTH domain